MPLRYDVSLAGQATTAATGSPAVAGQFSLASILGNVAIGQDVSGNFALTIGLSGLAVARPDGTWVSLDADADSLINATPFVIGGLDPLVFRLPTDVGSLQRGDIIVASDSPFSPLFVLEVAEGQIRALDPLVGQMVMAVPPRNLFFNFVVQAVSLLEVFVS